MRLRKNDNRRAEMPQEIVSLLLSAELYDELPKPAWVVFVGSWGSFSYLV
jgi:hypothetical protein